MGFWIEDSEMVDVILITVIFAGLMGIFGFLLLGDNESRLKARIAMARGRVTRKEINAYSALLKRKGRGFTGFLDQDALGLERVEGERVEDTLARYHKLETRI